MIVREPEKRATLDEVMSDIWYRQGEDEDDIDDDQYDNDLSRLISHDDHESILQQMINGNIATKGTILKALNEKHYNHITATYHLLAEKILHDKFFNDDRSVKRQRRILQPSNDLYKEKTAISISSSSK